MNFVYNLYSSVIGKWCCGHSQSWGWALSQFPYINPVERAQLSLSSTLSLQMMMLLPFVKIPSSLSSLFSELFSTLAWISHGYLISLSLSCIILASLVRLLTSSLRISPHILLSLAVFPPSHSYSCTSSPSCFHLICISNCPIQLSLLLWHLT